MIERRRFLSLCGLAGVGTFAGCAGNSRDESSPTPTRTSTDWTRQAKFTADDAYAGDLFGWSAAVSGDGTTAIVGAMSEGGLHRKGTEMTENPDGGNTNSTETSDSRGTGTAENLDGRHEGAAYVFGAFGESWNQQTRLPLDVSEGELFGCSVAVSDDGATARCRTPLTDSVPVLIAPSIHIIQEIRT